MNLLPVARQSDIILHDTDKELMIYDLSTNQAYALNETSKNVYQNCNGITSFDDLKIKYNYSDDFIFLALDELNKNDLLKSNYQSKFTGVSRREVIRKIGLASMIALPLITSLVAPRASRAASNCTANSSQAFNAGGTCTGSCANCQCARDYCDANAIPCCSGTFTTANYNGLRIFCNCN